MGLSRSSNTLSGKETIDHHCPRALSGAMAEIGDRMADIEDRILVLPPGSLQAAKVMLLRYYREGSPGSVGGLASILGEIIENNVEDSEREEWRNQLRHAMIDSLHS